MTKVYEADCEGSTTALPVVGRTVASALYYIDASGYTRLVLTFTDGTALVALEKGQAGYFTVTCEE